MNPRERCNCGSGKRYGDCCGKPGGVPVRQILVVCLVVVAAGAITAIGMSIQENARQEPGIGASAGPVGASVPFTTPPLPSGSTSSSPLGTTPTPQPWQYDPATNKHWHAEHGHWHDGPPPAGTTPGVPGGGSPVNATPMAAPPSTPLVANPNVPDPTPWQYDPVLNKHWHADHGHWHDGPPPANAGQ